LECAESTELDFGDEAMDLFYANVKSEKMAITYQAVNMDHLFAALAIDPAPRSPSPRRVAAAIWYC